MYKLKVNTHWYGSNKDCKFKTNLYKYNEVELQPGFTALVGCNGSGKTTLLHQLKDDLEAKGIPYLTYDDLHDGRSNAMESRMLKGDFSFVANQMISSEGEKMSHNISEFARKIGYFVYNEIPNGTTQAFLMFDAIDSGMSIDNIVEVKQDMFSFIIADCTTKGIELYIICSANCYELARESRCLDVNTGKYMQFKDYEEYRSFVLKSRKLKNKRYGHDDFNLT